jgi:hypothetical protein
LLAGARGFYLSLLERVFHVKILCLRAVISFHSSLLPIAFITRTMHALCSRRSILSGCPASIRTFSSERAVEERGRHKLQGSVLSSQQLLCGCRERGCRRKLHHGCVGKASSSRRWLLGDGSVGRRGSDRSDLPKPLLFSSFSCSDLLVNQLKKCYSKITLDHVCLGSRAILWAIQLEVGPLISASQVQTH